MAENDKDTSSPIPEERFTAEPAGEQQASQPLVILGQYIKDFSFEAPNTPKVFESLREKMPNIPIEIDVRAEGVGENIFEVILKVRAEAKADETLAYLLEMEYAGLFNINVPQEHLAQVILVDCPLILFPFLRRIVADTTSDGGFTPLMLAPMDFAALYQQRMAQAQAEGETQPTV